jgi:hypothetical protein
VLELHPSVNNQVFKHEGRMLGQGAEVTGPLGVVLVLVRTPAEVAVEVMGAEVTTLADELPAAVSVCWHFVQTVEVLVKRTVEVDWLVTMAVVPALVWVRVTGQTVVEVSITTVVITSLSAGVDVVSVPAAVEVVIGAELTAAELAGTEELADEVGTLITEVEVVDPTEREVGIDAEGEVSTPAEVVDEAGIDAEGEVSTPAEVVDEAGREVGRD